MRGVRNPSYRVLRAAVLTLWLIGTGLLIWLLLVYPNQYASAPYRDVVFEREPGESLPQLAQRLSAAQLIESPHALVWYMRLLGADAHLREGPVVANRSLAPRDLVLRLARGFGRGRVRVPMPEGFTRFDMAARLERYGVCTRPAFERATRDAALLQSLQIPGDSAEGYLFPATYELTQDSQAPDVVRRMVRTFRERMTARLRAYEQAHDGEALALTLHQIVTLASIVEREARMPDERPTIAGVFMNRLTSPTFRPRRLQADPTVAYGCLVARDSVPSCRDFDGKRVTPAMVRDPANPYSTYRIEGLPPGPICNPGLSALDAALAPAQHEFFYFVTHGGGRHHFTSTLEEHNQRVHTPP